MRDSGRHTRSPVGRHRFDRDDLLARTDLKALAEELLGPPRGRGSSAMWRCPDRGHGEQTGRTPPLSVFTDRRGAQRWKCHGCGAGGTAIDLVMTSHGVGFREALEVLAVRAGVNSRLSPPPAPVPPAAKSPAVAAPERAHELLGSFVSSCESFLWSPGGRRMRSWLADRGLGEPVLRANRVGADPGPKALRRERGLPAGGPAVVFPVIDGGVVTYLQARYLRPSARKYQNPAAAIAGHSPRMAEVRLASPAFRRDAVTVCEGMPDALTAAQAGLPAVAVLGAGYPNDDLAQELMRRFPGRRLVIAFDSDARGIAGSRDLVERLRDLGGRHEPALLPVPPRSGDLNAWLTARTESFGTEFHHAVDASIGSAIDPPCGIPPPDFDRGGIGIDL